jgi:ABC-type transport system involved in multi-copper enzyme maturation permease subunit
MIRALALKELREIFGIGTIALLVFLALVSNMVGLGLFSWIGFLPNKTGGIPFIDPSYARLFGFLAGAFAVALGFRQSAVEGARGTYLFLLHRPLSRRWLFMTKIGTGLAVYGVCSGIPNLLYAAWAAAPGNHPSPFAWSMTGLTWQLCFLMGLIYLGAFQSGLRPARWYGSRLAPLVVSFAVVPLVLFIPNWWLVGLPLSLVFAACQVSNISYLAQARDYS